jgi:hypothetical protein
MTQYASVMSSTRAEQLLSILRDSHDPHERDVASNELLNEVFRGYPFDLLVPILHGDDPRMVESIAWILSELGSGRASSIVPGPDYPGTAAYMDELNWLLGYPTIHVRFHAIGSVLLAASAVDGATIAKAIRQAADPERPIRFMVLRLLAYGSEGQLRAGLANLEQGPVREQLEWLVTPGCDPANTAEVVRRIDEGAELEAMFALAAAVRVGRYDLNPIEHASHSSNGDVASFAGLAIKNLAFLAKRKGSSGMLGRDMMWHGELPQVDAPRSES